MANNTVANNMEVLITPLRNTKAITEINSTEIKTMDTKTTDITKTMDTTRIMDITRTATMLDTDTSVLTDTVVNVMISIELVFYLFVYNSMSVDIILGYPGGYGYYGRPQGVLGVVGNVLDGLLGLREGEKKPASVDGGDTSSAPVVAASEAVDPSAIVPVADSAPQTSVVDAQLPEPAVPESQGPASPSGGEEVIFQ